MSLTMLSAHRAAIDIFIKPCESPTGHAIRFRRKFTVEHAGAAKALEAEIISSLYKSGSWAPIQELKVAPTIDDRPRASRSLQAALTIAWECVERGWSFQRDGAKQHKLAKECINLLGAYTPVARITRDHYVELRKAFMAAGNKEATIQRKLQAFYRVLWFAQREGWIRQRPALDRRKLVNDRRFTYSPELEQRILAHWATIEARPEMQDLFVLGIEIGCRLNELLTMEGTRVDFTLGVALIPDALAKNGQFRQVVITPRAEAVLKRRVNGFGKGLLFPRWTCDKVGKRMYALRQALGINDPEAVFHATRHTCGSRMAAAGVPLADIMEQLGHKTPSMSLRYIHMTAQGRRKTLLGLMAAATGPSQAS